MKNTKKQLLGILICLVIAAAAAGIGVGTGSVGNVTDVIPSINIAFSSILTLIVMVALIMAISRLVILILTNLKISGHRTGTVITISISMIRYGAVILGICWGLSILGMNVSTIAASVGIITLIVGFSAESLIEDVITGLFMLFENQYNVGDIVEVNGFRGTVSDIGIRTTSITDAGGNVKIINNSNMKDILNRSDKLSRSVCDIQIPYEADLLAFENKLPDILNQFFEAHNDCLLAIPQYLGVQELAESGVTLRFVAEVDEKNVFSVQRLLNHDLYIAFGKAGIEIPYPQVDVHRK